MKRIRTILRALDPKAAATMSRRERTEAFRIRRSVVAWILALCVIVSCTSCSVHAVLVNAVLNGHAKTAQIGNSGTRSEKTDQSAKAEKKSQQSEKKTQESSETKDAKASAEETAEPQEDAVTKSASRAVGRADGRSEKRNTCESAANGAKQRIWHGAISLLCGHQW